MRTLPVSHRPLPDKLPFIHTESFLNGGEEANGTLSKPRLSCLRLLADWLQSTEQEEYSEEAWPLDPAQLTNEAILQYRTWLVGNRSINTARIYARFVHDFLIHLDSVNALPVGISLLAVAPESGYKLPITQRPLPQAEPFVHVERYLKRGNGSQNTRQTHLSSLRLFADWLQGNDTYSGEVWPLDLGQLTNKIIAQYQTWLFAHRSRTTALNYLLVLAGFLEYLQQNQLLPEGINVDVVRPQRVSKLPLSKRPAPDEDPWLKTSVYLSLLADYSHNTAKTYLVALRVLADWVQHNEHDGYGQRVWPLDPQHLTTQTLIEYDRWLIQNRARRTRYTYLSGLLWYLDELEASAQLPPNVHLGQLRARLRTRRHNKTSASARIVSLDQARKNVPLIVRYYDELPLSEQQTESCLVLLRNRAIVNLLFSTAMRVEEALKLNRGTVQDGRASNALIVGKGGRERTIHIQPYAQRAIQSYLADRTDTAAALFVSHSRRNQHHRLTQRTVQLIVKGAIKALGLDPLLSPHDFRHYKATLLLRRGMKLEVLQEYLGHADLSTTRRIYAPLLGVEIVRGELKDFDLSPSEAAALLEK